MENQGSGGPDLVVRAYVCKLHGRFERRVDSADVPPEVACAEMAWGVRCGLTSALVRCLCQEPAPMRGQTCPVHDLGLQPGPAEGLGAAQVAQLEASIREAEQDVLDDESDRWNQLHHDQVAIDLAHDPLNDEAR